MIAKLQNTDKFLLEHAYAQTRLYSTQLYTEDLNLDNLGSVIKNKGTENSNNSSQGKYLFFKNDIRACFV